MARRNRKRHVEGFAVPVPFTGIVIICVVFALIYVCLASKCDVLGREIAVLEKQKDELSKQLAYEECKWAKMKSRDNIEKAMLRFNIAMDLPNLAQQVVRIHPSELPAIEFDEDVPLQYAKIEKDPF